jgi:preprotein translocase subunit SecA
MEEDVPIEHGLVTRAIENAQKKDEAHNFDIRKHLLEYDDVMNQQREVVYGYRRQILAGSGLREMVQGFGAEAAQGIAGTHVEEKSNPDEWDWKAISDAAHKQFGIQMPDAPPHGVSRREELIEWMTNEAWKLYTEKASGVGNEMFSRFERIIMLHTLDTLWKDHLLSMDHLKGGIGLRGYGQKNPLQEYKKEGFDMFVDMIATLKSEATERLFRVQIRSEEETADAEEQVAPPQPPPLPSPKALTYGRGEGQQAASVEPEKERPQVRHGDKIGRNDPCPCGSGKKYKKCCGAKAGE